MKGYRFVTEDLKSKHGDVQWKIGEWQKLPNNKPLELCENGFHASQQPLDSLDYVFGSRWFQCEAKGEILEDSDKFCAREMRLSKEIPVTVIKQFAIEAAKHVLPIFEKKYPGDKRPRKAIEAAEAYLKTPSKKNLKILKKAVDAAWAAARDARAAARAAAWAARAAARDARAAARDARAAARDARAAAWAAAWDAAREKERRWQNRKLKQLIRSATEHSRKSH